MAYEVELIESNSFEPGDHFYPKALNSQLHAMVGHFFNLGHERLIKRYCYLNPQIESSFLSELLKYKPSYFHWGGSDLFYVTTEAGSRQMVVLETNSCPSGQKSMPIRIDDDDQRGYRMLLENSFLPLLKKKRLPQGALAVVYDKNYMENSGYAAALADLTGEKVYLVPDLDGDSDHVTFENGVMQVMTPTGDKVAIRAVFRYVTQKPWNRLPIQTKTFIYNSSLVCLAGGRNKLLADKAYEFFNSEIADSGLKIRTPATVRDVSKVEIPLWVEKFGGYAVVKIPYTNAGQGVFTITSPEELKRFMDMDHAYDQFVVQSLIGHPEWSSQSENGRYYHIGTIPSKKGRIYVADLRVMIYSSPEGLQPCAIYARRAKDELKESIDETQTSWDVLGTNLSKKVGENQWETDTQRLVLMDRKDFNTLGIGTDDLIEAYIQTVLCLIAIDKMAQRLISKKGAFRMKLFKSLDNDETLVNEILI